MSIRTWTGLLSSIMSVYDSYISLSHEKHNTYYYDECSNQLPLQLFVSGQQMKNSNDESVVGV